MPTTEVFISYSRSDSSAAQALHARLATVGISAFLDRYKLPAGQAWQPQLEQAIARCDSMAVLLGPSGIGTWQHREIQLGLDRQAACEKTNRPFAVLPVLLQGLEDRDAPLGRFLGLNTWIDLRGDPDDPEALQRLIAGVQGQAIDAVARAQHLAGLCPYRGLLPFREEDAGLFFGRRRYIDELVRNVRQRSPTNLVAVVGRSGSGKSSIVYAGLLPVLRKERGLGNEAVWDMVSLRPGSEPLHALIDTFDPPREEASRTQKLAQINDGVELLRAKKVSLAQLIRDRLKDDIGTTRLLLYVDQWEELYTQAQTREVRTDEDKRRAEDARLFIDLVLDAAATSPCTLVLTVRSDFYPDIQGHDRLREAVQQCQVSLGPMTEAELRDAIEGPAKAVGARVDGDLTDRLLRDIGLDVTAGRQDEYDIGKLPLLEYALEQAWVKRENARIGLAQYLGLERALDDRATKLYAELSDEQKDAAKRLFVSLVTPGEGREDTRARIALPTDSATREVVQKFAGPEARLLVTGEHGPGGAVAEVTHEALIRHWGELRQWVDENRVNLRTRADVARDREDWQNNKKSKDLLIPPGLRLEAARKLREQPGDVVIGDVKDYIDASIAAEQRRARWRRIGVAALGLVALGMAGLAWFAKDMEESATQQAAAARSAEEAATQQAAAARRAEQETIRQTRAGALAAAGYARKFIDEGNARVGALIALGVIPASRSDRDSRYVPQAEVALANALSLPFETMRLRGHEGEVTSVAFSPDGRRIVSGSGDKTLRLWDAATGQPVGAPLRGHEAAVLSVAFSPDGKRIVSGSTDQTLRLWDAATGQPVGEPLRGHEGPVYSVAFSPDGQRIVSGSWDETLRLWDAATGQPVGEPLRGHEAPVFSVAFSPDGKRIVSGSWDKTLRLWDAATGQPVGEPLRGHEGEVTSVAFSPDGKRIVSGSGDKTLRLWDAATGQPVGEPLRGHEGEVTSVAFSPDGRRIVSGSGDKTLRLWDAATGQPVGAPLRGHEAAVLSVAFSPDGQRIVSGSTDQTLRLWDAATGQPVGEQLRGHEGEVTSVAFSPDGKRIVSGSKDQTLRLWDAATGQPVGEPLRGHENVVWSVAFSPDGQRIVSGSWDKTLRLWDAASGQPVGEPLRGHEAAVWSVAFSPDGRRIVSGSGDKTLRLWDAATRQPVGEPLRGHEDVVSSVAFSPDGRRIISGSGDKTLRLWDAATGQPVGEPLRGHKDEVTSVAFSPDGRRIVSGSWDKTLRLWDAATGQPVGEPLRGHEAAVLSVAFSPDGQRIVSGSLDKTLRLWDAGNMTAPLAALVAEAEELCPLSRAERTHLQLVDPLGSAENAALTPAQRRACGGDLDR